MKKLTDFFGDAKNFSTLDANTDYWQIEMNVDKRDKTVLATHHGLFGYKQMAFRLRNTPATFQCAMNDILAMMKWQYALEYLHDIVVFLQMPSQHIE